MKACLKVIFTFGLLSTSLFLFAQNTGEVQGTIRDAVTGDPLSYASIQIVGTAFGAISDDQGTYTIKKIRPGTYELNVSFMGYAPTSETVQVQAGQVATQDISLAITTIQGEEVVITAMARGQAKAINTQLVARNIKNVISEQKIRELPDANAAEALSRLPGVSIERSGGEATAIRVRGVGTNSMYVNGMRMSGDLSSISSSMIGSIELSKAFMPDRDADVLGGSVDFKLREATSGFHTEVWARTGYNNFTKSFKMHDLSLQLSNRFFNDRLGVMLSMNYDRKNRGRDVLNATYRTLGSSASSEVVKQVKLTRGDLQRIENLNDRYGATFYSDFKFENGKLYYQSFFSYLSSDNVTSGTSLTTGEFAPTMSYSTTFNEDFSNNFLQGLGGEHQLLGGKIEWSASMSKNKDSTPRQFTYYGYNYEGVPSSGDMDSTTLIGDLVNAAHHDLADTWAYRINKNNSERYTDEMSAKLDVELPYGMGKHIRGYLKFGGKVRDINRGYHSNFYWGNWGEMSTLQIINQTLERMPEYDWKFAENGWLGHESFVSEPYSQDFTLIDGAQLWYQADRDKLSYVLGNVEDLLEKSMAGERNNYTNEQINYAGYIMSGIDIGKFVTFTPGVRYERFEYSTTAKNHMQAPDSGGRYPTQGTIKDTTNGHFNAHFFPMLHLKIKPLEWFDIRLAATKTASRPSFSLMSPKYSRSGGYDITKGDVYLKPQINYNYDIYFSFYTKKLGLFTIGAFYKKIEDQVLNYSIVIIDPEEYGLPPAYANKNYTYPKNNEWPGYVQGLEIDWQTHFSYLPKPLNGIVLNANVTILQSEIKYPFYSFRTVTIPEYPYITNVGEHNFRSNTIIGMPDMVGNVALGYEVGGFAGRISLYYQSSTITAAQSSNIALDVDKDALLRMDMQLSQKFKKVPGLGIYLNINNLTNNADRRILTYHPERIIREEVYGVNGDIGVRYKF